MSELSPTDYSGFLVEINEEYRDNLKLQPLVAEISWTKNLLIMARCKDEQERYGGRR